MLDPDLKEKIDLHLRGDLGELRRFQMKILGILHNISPDNFKLLNILNFSTKIAIASSAPIFMYFYSAINLSKAVFASITLVALNILFHWLNRKSSGEDKDREAAQIDMMYRIGDFVGSYQGRGRTRTNEKDDAIRSLLGILEIFTRETTGCKKGQVGVNLVLYTGNSTTRMRIKHRNPGNERPTTRADFAAEDVIGHYVCQIGNYPHLIKDVKILSRKGVVSPTGSKANYGSILFFPLEVDENGENRIKGFVSIDSVRRYAFKDGKDEEIVTVCGPVFDHLKHLI